MKCMVVRKPGGPEALEYETREKPQSAEGWARIRIRALGLNRAEMFTRQGHSPSVKFPRIIGIECVGEMDETVGDLPEGAIVATMMGEMGRAYDGSYAQYTVVPMDQILRVPQNDLPWYKLGAIPEMYQTASGALKEMGAKPGQTILIRGGTSSVGRTAIALCRNMDMEVWATSRRAEACDELEQLGAKAILDNGELAHQIQELSDGGVDLVLELVGTRTLNDSLDCCKKGGVVSMTGILGNSWSFEEWSPMSSIPSGVFLTAYHGYGMEQSDFDSIVQSVSDGTLPLPLDKVFALKDMARAHERMESSSAGGKMVALPWEEDLESVPADVRG